MNQITTSTPDVSSENVSQNSANAVAYVAPAIESVFTSDDMAREVLYAGVIPTSQVPLN